MPTPKGISGNPNGRPPKERALTTRLALELSKLQELPDGTKVSGKVLLARMRVEAALTGRITLLDGTTRELTTEQLVNEQEWIYRQVDGPPRAELDVTSGGGPLKIVVEYADVDLDPAAAAPGASGDQAGSPAL